MRITRPRLARPSRCNEGTHSSGPPRTTRQGAAIRGSTRHRRRGAPEPPPNARRTKWRREPHGGTKRLRGNGQSASRAWGSRVPGGLRPPARSRPHGMREPRARDASTLPDGRAPHLRCVYAPDARAPRPRRLHTPDGRAPRLRLPPTANARARLRRSQSRGRPKRARRRANVGVGVGL